MKEVLLPVGSIIKATPPRGEQEEWLIVGRRCINPDSMKAWDYVAVSRRNGYKWFVTNEKKFEPAFFYFNHPDIEEIVFEQQEPDREDTMKDEHCAICGKELDENSHYDDTCDDCAREEGLLDTE